MLGLKYDDLSPSPFVMSQIFPHSDGFFCVCFCLFCGTSGWILSLILPVQQDHPKDSWAPSCWWKVFHGLFISFCFRLTCPGDLWGWCPSRTRRRWAVWAIGFPPVFKTTAVVYISIKTLWWKMTHAVIRITHAAVKVHAFSNALHTCCLVVVAHPRRGWMLCH